MSTGAGIGGGAAAPWYRVVAVPDAGLGGTAQRDYAAVLPALLEAANGRRPFVVGWFCRGGGAPLELITNAGPLPPVPSWPPAESGRASVQAGPLPIGPPAPGPLAPGPLAPGPLAADSAAGDLPVAHSLLPADTPASGRAPGGQTGPGQSGPRELLFPWGARGVPYADSVLSDLDRLVWAPCPGRRVAPAGDDAAWRGQPWAPPASALPGGQPGGWLGAGQGPAGSAPTLFESALAALAARPFGWLVVAEPSDLIDAEMAELRTQLDAVRRFDAERARYDAELIAGRLAELDAFREAGLWNVRVLVGAADPAQLRLLAPMLVGSADLAAHPYRLRGPGRAMDLADALAAASADPADGSLVPFPATAGVLAALAGLPRREVPGVRVLDVGYFDVTAESSGDDQISIGAILDGQDRAVGSLGVPLATLNRHALVTGATGAGKSQTVRHLLEQLTGAGIPWLVVEPVKSEYASLAGRIAAAGGSLTVVNPSDPAAIPIAINPLEPEPGYPVQAHIDMVRALFLAAFDAREPFPQIVSQALQRAYEARGWDPVTGAGRPGAATAPSIPSLADLQAAAIEVIDDVGYGRELSADVRGFVDVRLRSLRTGSAGRFFEGGHPADIAGLLAGPVVLAIEDVANDEDKAFLIGTLIIRITEHLRLRARAGRVAGLSHVTVIEEAHRLLRGGREGPAGHAVELFAAMLAEIRAYGEGLVIAEQIPAKLVPDVVKNTALKIVHRLPALDDRQLVGATMNLDAEQSRQVVSFPPGVAAVFADGMDRPLRIRVPLGAPAARPDSAGGGRSAAGAAGCPPVAGRRSPACGPVCQAGPACTLIELRTADLEAGAPESAWLRVWAEALTLAFLTNSPLPVVPAALRQWWVAGPDARLRECALATVIDRCVAGRSAALREYLDLPGLAGQLADTALRLLGGGKGAGTQIGTAWVIPQLQWLHEIERALPLTGPTPDPFELALPLDFELPGLLDRSDILLGQRISLLRRHPYSMELDRNRLVAWIALLGEDDQRGLAADLGLLAVGASYRGQLMQAAGEMGIVGWLEPVLSWPRRFIVGLADDLTSAAVANPEPVAG